MEVAGSTRDEAKARLLAPGSSLLHRTEGGNRPLLLSLRLRNEVRCWELRRGLIISRRERLVTAGRSLNRLLPRPKTRPALLTAGGASSGASTSRESLWDASQQWAKMRAFLGQVGALVAEIAAEANYLELPAEAVPQSALQTLLLLRPFVVLPRRQLPGLAGMSFLLCYPIGANAVPFTTGTPSQVGYCCLEFDFNRFAFALLPTWPDQVATQHATQHKRK